MEISVIVPCYNSTPILRTLIKETILVFNNMKIKEYEFVFVNDCSPKLETIDYLKELANEFGCIKIVDLAHNTGQANAQIAALNHASGEYVINMDDDMQTHPKNIPILYKKIQEGYDLVLGKYTKKKHALHRRLLTYMDDKFEEVFLKKPVGMSFTSFWITRRYVVEEIIKYKNPYAFMEGLFLRTAGRITNAEIEHFERQEGESGYNLKKLVALWSNFTGFTILPLRICDALGILTGLAGMIYAVIIVIRKITDPGMPMGYASMICLMLIFFGIILFFMGVMGEYIGRIFMSVSSTPQYVIKQVYDSKKSSEEKHK